METKMKFQIREGTFETNSSSAHTVVLRGDNTYENKEAFVDAIANAEEIADFLRRENKSVEGTNNMYFPLPSLTDNNFNYGHGYEMLHDWEEKMYYLIASFHWNFEKLFTIVDVVKARIPEFDGIITSFNYDDIIEKIDTGFPVFIDYNTLGYSFGSIDHQSYDNADNMIDALRKDPEYKDKSLAEIFDEIIFSKKFVIIIDSDESDTFNSLYTSGVYTSCGFTKILRSEFCNDDSSDGYHYENTFENIDEYYSEKERDDEM